MAATRKLQGEIDRCLKKVTEGVETFEDIWQKVHNANNSNPKVLEKYESDLKKEIKKLQRLRDQIKSWIASGEIKDKSALLENRRLIETQMERFKVVERETKTKAYSKEGLGAAQKLDPAQRVKDEIRSWLTSSISSLQIQIDQYESEIESLLAGKKKRLDRDKQDRMDELRSKLDRHKFHVTKLETLLRLLDNDSVEADQIRKIKDDVEYYIESSQEPDFEENEFLYDDIIGLDEVELSGTGVPSSATTDSNNSNLTAGSPSNSIISGSSPVQSPIQLNCSSSTTNNNLNNINNLNCSSDSTSVDITAADKRNKNETNASTKPVVKPTAVRAKDANFNTATSTSHTSTNSTISSVLSQQQQPLQPSNKVIMSSTPSKPSAPSLSSTSASISSTNLTTNNSTAAIQPATPFAAVAKSLFIPTDSVVAHVSTSNSITSSTTATLNSSRTSPTPIRLSPGLLSPKIMNGPLMVQQQQPTQQLQPPPQQTPPQQDASTLKTIAQEAINRSTNNSIDSIIPIPSSVSSGVGVIPRAVQQPPPLPPQPQLQPPTPQQQSQQHFSSTASSVASASVPPTESTVTISSSVTTNGPILSTGDQQASLSSSLKQQQSIQSTNEAHIPPLLGVAPLGPQPLQKEQQYQFQMMESSSHHLPQLSDSERLGTYYHRHPVQTPAHYPQTQPPHYDVVEFFQRLNTDTLFFVFYYMEGTKAQYLAAKALKKQSWRFHTKYYMWFQRHEEPKIINDDYEQGTYIYFDYEKWAQRKKEGFTFEYKYLEDKDLN